VELQKRTPPFILESKPMPQSSIKALIESSGNNFHAKVARWFQNKDWHIVVSPYYMDQTQSKSRELDLIAEKLWPFNDELGHFEGHVVVRLFIECKFVADEAVFWFAPKDPDASKELVKRTAPFRDNNAFTLKHHYLSHGRNVAKLFASKKSSENDPFFKALNQALNAFVALRHGTVFHPAIHGDARRGRIVKLQYPIIVCSSFAKLHATKFLEETEPTPIQENFQLEVRYAFTDKENNHRSEYFLLDVIDFEQLQSFENAIEEDAKVASRLA
jgi:hypothetical protein